MMWTELTNLTDIEKTIELIFEEKLRLRAKVCDVIDLSFDEYIALVDKIKLVSTVEAIDRYSLAILAAWVTSYKFNRNEAFYELAKSVMSQLPQHHTKFVLEALNTTFYDYQIDTFNHKIDSIRKIHDIVKIHAGF